MSIVAVRVAIALVMLASCSEQCGKPEADTPQRPSPAQWYWAALEGGGHAIPFFLWLPESGSKEQAMVANGDDRHFADLVRSGRDIELSFPIYDGKITGRFDDAGFLRGELLTGRIDGSKTFPVIGHPIPEPNPMLRFEATATAAVDVTGIWRFESENIHDAKAILEQKPTGEVTGTVLQQKNSDYQTMAGLVRGRELVMSRFDGLGVVLFRAEIDAQGRMSGLFTWPEHFSEAFRAERVPDVPIDFLHQTKMRPGMKSLSLRKLDRYAGKPVLVDFFATWCPACIEMAPFLAELRQKYRAQGLEMLSVGVELTSDAAYAARLVDAYRKRFGVDWETMIVLGESENLAELLPPELEDLTTLPVTVFINRNGSVHAVHTGFAGRITGVEHQRVRMEFERLVQEIIDGS